MHFNFYISRNVLNTMLSIGLKYYFQSQNTILYRFHPQLPRWLPVLERRRSPWSSWTNETSGETPTGRAWWYSSSSNRRFLYLAVLFLSTQKELGSRTQTQVYRPIQEWKTHPGPCSASYRSVSPELSSWNQVEKPSVWMEWYWVRHLQSDCQNCGCLNSEIRDKIPWKAWRGCWKLLSDYLRLWLKVAA